MNKIFIIISLILVLSCKKEERVSFDVSLLNAKTLLTPLAEGKIRVGSLDDGTDFETTNGSVRVTVSLGKFIIKPQTFVVNVPGYKVLTVTHLIGKDQNEEPLKLLLSPLDKIIFSPNPIYLNASENTKLLEMKNNGIDSLNCKAEVILAGSSSWLSLSPNTFSVGPIEQTSINLSTDITTQSCRIYGSIVVSFISDNIRYYDTIRVIKDVLDVEHPTAIISSPSILASFFTGESILFDGVNSTDNCSLLEYHWSFDNGVNFTAWSSNPKDTFSYSSTGSKTVVLEVRDIQGLISSENRTFNITPAPTPPIISGDSVYVTESDTVLSLNMVATVTDLGFPVYTSLINHGFVWSQNTNMPTLTSNSGKIELGSTTFTGSFSSLSEPLLPNVKYYIRAFAQNGAFTTYSDVTEFIPQIVQYESISLSGMGFNFFMGSSFLDQTPVHSVTFVSDFELSKTEVTNEEYAAFLEANSVSISNAFNYISYNASDCHIDKIAGSWRASLGYEDFPIVMVNWEGARAFCEWAGGRLPTEAEWEFVASISSTGSAYPSSYSHSSSISSSPAFVANYNDGTSPSLEPVAQRAPNDFNVYDMNGNAAEWCSDWYGAYSAGAQTDPEGPISGSQRIVRGGSFLSNAIEVENRHRDKSFPVFQQNNIGFRVAK